MAGLLYSTGMDNTGAKVASAKLFDKATQMLLPVLTLGGYALTSARRPELGVVVSMSAQIFWLYAGWQAYKKAGQIGILITAVLLTLILAYGIVNYWLI